MNYLLDTHVFLWILSDPDKLSLRAKEVIENANANLFLSPVSGLEIAIKSKIGKLILPEAPDIYIMDQICRFFR